jgi:xylulokinase
MGGASRSPLWLSIKASVNGCTMIPLKARESGCLGAALLAGVGIGRYPDIDTAAQGLALTGEAIMPDPSLKPCYDEAFRRYVALYESLKPFFSISV